MIDFELGDALLALQDRVRAFVDAEVIPREPEVTRVPAALESVRRQLQSRARSAGLFLPTGSKDLGGLGLNWREIAVWLLDRGEEARDESSMAKVFVAETVNKVIDRAVQICGALGISDDTQLSTFYKEARPFRIYDGPSEVHRGAIARRALRRGAQR